MTSSNKKKEKLIRNELLSELSKCKVKEKVIFVGGRNLMITVIIMLLLKYSVEILVGNKKVGKNFGR